MTVLSTSLARQLHRNRFIYRSVSAAPAHKRRVILKSCPANFYNNIKSLCNCLVDGRISLKLGQKRKLKPHAKLIRGISKTSQANLRKHIIMRGNGFGSFLKSILPIVTPVLAALI